MDKLTYVMVVHREVGGYWASFPELPGCVTEGDSLEELRANAVDAVCLYLSSLHADGEEIPEGIGSAALETLAVENDPHVWAEGVVEVKPSSAEVG